MVACFGVKGKKRVFMGIESSESAVAINLPLISHHDTACWFASAHLRVYSELGHAMEAMEAMKRRKAFCKRMQ